MTLRNQYRGLSDRPFPDAKPTLRMKQEDRFMELYGGHDARLIYLTVQALSRLMKLAFHPVSWLLRSFRS